MMILVLPLLSHKKELHSSYASSNVIRVIKSRRMRWVSRRRIQKDTKF